MNSILLALTTPLIVAAAVVLALVVVALIVLVVILARKRRSAPSAQQTVNEQLAPVEETEEETEEEVEEEDKAEPQTQTSAEQKKSTVKTYHISARKADNARAGQKSVKKDQMWQVKLAGGQKAIKLFATQAEAIEFAKGLCENNESARIVIHKEDGTFRRLTYKK